jgi:hypothetical protein
MYSYLDTLVLGTSSNHSCIGTRLLTSIIYGSAGFNMQAQSSGLLPGSWGITRLEVRGC